MLHSKVRLKMKIYIWGTGRLSGKVIDSYIALERIEAFIDNDSKKTEYMGKKVHRPKEMVELEYDAICVVNQYSKEIREQCKNIGINLNKVIF